MDKKKEIVCVVGYDENGKPYYDFKFGVEVTAELVDTMRTALSMMIQVAHLETDGKVRSW